MIGLCIQYIIYLSSILKNTDDYSRYTKILNFGFLVIYDYMYKYIVDSNLVSKLMHINTVAP